MKLTKISLLSSRNNYDELRRDIRSSLAAPLNRYLIASPAQVVKRPLNKFTVDLGDDLVQKQVSVEYICELLIHLYPIIIHDVGSHRLADPFIAVEAKPQCCPWDRPIIERCPLIWGKQIALRADFDTVDLGSDDECTPVQLSSNVVDRRWLQRLIGESVSDRCDRLAGGEFVDARLGLSVSSSSSRIL